MTGVHDVAVAGGGLVGATVALALARAGRRVALMDQAEPRVQHGRLGVDIRNIACSPASRSVLEAAGVWSRLRAAPYRKMCVWEERGTAEIDFAAREVGRSELGWILENSPTVVALWAELAGEPGVDRVLGCLTGVEVLPDRVRVSVDGQEVQARLLIGADGARSAVRALTGTGITPLPTGHHALATVVRTERGHNGVAYQRFLLGGPLALLPSREPDLSSVVWSQSPDAAAERQALPEEAFCAALEEAVESRLGRVLAADHRPTFPLQQHVVDSFNPAGRVLLIGDAARVLHPLAGLGANVGFEDVREVLAVMARLPAGADPGTPGIWRPFARRRRARARMMVAAMAGFRYGYALSGPLPGWIRNRAVSWVDRTAAVKRQFIREALGLAPVASG